LKPIDFRAGRSARQAHCALLESLRAIKHAKSCAVIWFADIYHRKLYRTLGYSSMRQYATEELGFSRSRCGEFLRLARRLDELPAVRESLELGRIGYTQATEITKVAGPTNQQTWVNEAERCSRSELRRRVKQARSEAGLFDRPGPAFEGPIRVGLEMTPVQKARFEAQVETLRKQGADLSKVELLLEALDTLIETREGAGRPAPGPGAVVHVQRCPDCEKATVQTNSGEHIIEPAEAERLAEDAVISEPGRPNRRTIPPKRRRDAMARARHRCESPGCGHARFLEIHHIEPRSRGGTNELSNLRVLCSACHRLVHERGITCRSP